MSIKTANIQTVELLYPTTGYGYRDETVNLEPGTYQLSWFTERHYMVMHEGREYQTDKMYFRGTYADLSTRPVKPNRPGTRSVTIGSYTGVVSTKRIRRA